MSKSPIIERKESQIVIPPGKLLLEIEIEAYQELQCPKNTRSLFSEDLTIKQLIRQFVSKGSIGIKLKELCPDEPSAISEEQFEIVSRNYEKEKSYIPKSKTLKELGLQNYDALILLYFRLDSLKLSKEPLPVTPSNAFAFLVPSNIQDSWNVSEGDVYRVVKVNNRWCLVEKLNDFVLEKSLLKVFTNDGSYKSLTVTTATTSEEVIKQFLLKMELDLPSKGFEIVEISNSGRERELVSDSCPLKILRTYDNPENYKFVVRMKKQNQDKLAELLQ